MKRIFISILCFSQLAFSQDLTLEVKNFNYNYKDPLGEGTATSFTMDGLNEKEQVKVVLEKIAESFNIKVSGTTDQEFEFKDAPSFMTKAEKMTIKGFNLSFKARAAFSLGQGSFISPGDQMNLQNLTFDCFRDKRQKELMDQMLSGCIQNMRVKAASFTTASEDQNNFIAALASSLISVIEEEHSLVLAGTVINSLDLKVTSGKYEMVAEIRAQISGKAKSHGNISYDPSAKKLVIKISEVKFGIINITSRVFAELKQKESEKMQVRQPYVYLTLK